MATTSPTAIGNLGDHFTYNKPFQVLSITKEGKLRLEVLRPALMDVVIPVNEDGTAYSGQQLVTYLRQVVIATWPADVIAEPIVPGTRELLGLTDNLVYGIQVGDATTDPNSKP